jgi:hypothetical protein
MTADPQDDLEIRERIVSEPIGTRARRRRGRSRRMMGSSAARTVSAAKLRAGLAGAFRRPRDRQRAPGARQGIRSRTALEMDAEVPSDRIECIVQKWAPLRAPSTTRGAGRQAVGHVRASGLRRSRYAATRTAMAIERDLSGALERRHGWDRAVAPCRERRRGAVGRVTRSPIGSPPR